MVTRGSERIANCEYRIEVRERRGDEDEPVAENRAPNDSRKGSKLHFDLKKIE